MTTDLAPLDLMPTSTPKAVIEAAKSIAVELTALVKQSGWEVKIAGRPHLKVEAWQTLANFYGCTPRTVSTAPISYGSADGWEAVAEILHRESGRVIGRGEGMCLNDEENWSTRPKYNWDEATNKKTYIGEVEVPAYALRSMAQTRASAKAMRLVFAWIIVLAGYEGTPAEEMPGAEGSEGGNGNGAQRAATNTPKAAAGKAINENQVKLFFRRVKDAQWTEPEWRALLKEFSFDDPAGIMGNSTFNQILARIAANQKAKPAAAQPAQPATAPATAQAQPAPAPSQPTPTPTVADAFGQRSARNRDAEDPNELFDRD
jgi:hypothetical protein